MSRWGPLLTILALEVLAGSAGLTRQPQSGTPAEYGQVRGQVLDAATRQGILDASVALSGTLLGCLTDSAGQYAITQVPPGTYRLRANSVFFRSMELDSITTIGGQTTIVDFLLTRKYIRDVRSQREYDSGYALGWHEADEEIACGRPIWQVEGMQEDCSRSFDEGSALPMSGSSNRAITAFEEGKIAGHNEYIRRFLRTPGAPDLTLKHWVSEILHPGEYFRKMRSKESPIRLDLKGSAVEARGSTYTIGLIFEQSTDNEKPVLRSCLQISGPRGLYRLCSSLILQSYELFWGPEGSDVVFLCWTKESHNRVEGVTHAALDLRSGIILKVDGAASLVPDPARK